MILLYISFDNYLAYLENNEVSTNNIKNIENFCPIELGPSHFASHLCKLHYQGVYIYRVIEERLNFTPDLWKCRLNSGYS